ncbi:pheromone-processing carboxypeptidase KEX1-like [Mastacembelus armatus]|uniref:pheromone-processing carboxypeptidase KEX1-like n=1 Tax=Mastacembelus armatus TaxID=205130 RepID=UPI000E45EAD9|nr:pheromone-processing carboxypeptidase KEX1-like [Mastacembelus armatus]
MPVKEIASLLSLCLSVSLVVCMTGGQINITAEPGDTVTLPCRAPSSSEISYLKWDRPDLKSGYVFLYRSKRFDPDNQHPSFKERVELKDSQMKDGDLSVTLKNVTFNDTGTYKCRVFQRPIICILAQPDLLSTVHLRVVPAGHREGGGDEDEGDKDGGDKDGGDMDGGDKDGGDKDGGDTDGGDMDGGDMDAASDEMLKLKRIILAAGWCDRDPQPLFWGQ